MKYISYIFALIVVVIATGFSILNAQQVELHYYLGSLTISLSLLLLLVLCLGIVLGAIIFLPGYIRFKYSNRKLRHSVQQYEEEIRNLRTFPIQDDH